LQETRIAQTQPAQRLREKTLESLDFPEIRRALAGNAMFPPARELALALAPSYDEWRVEELQHETSEALRFITESGDIDLHATGDATEAIERAGLGGGLTGVELLEVSASLEVQKRARAGVLKAKDRAPILADLAESIPQLNELQRRIAQCIGSRGDVMDSATPSLGILRRQSREAYQRVVEGLQKVMHSGTGKEALQDNVISMRGDRLVVQVKTEFRRKVPGIVHDASNTGATLYIEPFATVELCNDWLELVLEEERETQRVLMELSGLVGAVSEEIKEGVALTAQIDFILARARYSARLRGVTAQLAGRTESGAAGIRLLNARHPLLGSRAVPVTMQMAPELAVLAITGPNTGGKTVSMKTVGLLALMNQSGLQISASEGSYLPVFDGVFADVGDQQSIQGSVSTFSSHMLNVTNILENATSKSLVLLDELGTSTDPEEGSALAKAILSYLARNGIKTIVTTHHRSVATHVEGSPAMLNASVDLDPKTLRPTYRLTLGVPGRSYAMSIAAQLGLPPEIMAEARSLLEPQHIQVEDWLNELQLQRDQLKTKLEEAEKSRIKAEALQRDLDAKLADLESREEDILHTMRSELSQQFEEARQRLRKAESALSWASAAGEPVPAEEIKRARAELLAARQKAEEFQRRPSPLRRAELRPIAVGDTVTVKGIGVQGKVVSIGEQGGPVEVAVGDVRFSLDRDRVLHPDAPVRDEPKSEVSYDMGPMVPAVELQVRGMRVEEALIKVEEFIDRAVRDGVTQIRIVHGKGTGALRNAIRDLLKGHRLVRSFAPEAQERGGDGATVVEL